MKSLWFYRGYVSGEARLPSSRSEYKLLSTFEFIKAVSDTVLYLINAAYHDKPLQLIGAMLYILEKSKNNWPIAQGDSCVPDSLHRYPRLKTCTYSNLIIISILKGVMQCLFFLSLGQNEKYTNRVFLIYDGIHYDPLCREPKNSPGQPVQTLFPVDDDTVYGEALSLSKEARQVRETC